MIDQKQLDQALLALCEPSCTGYQQLVLDYPPSDPLLWLASQHSPLPQGYWRDRHGSSVAFIGSLREALTLDELTALSQALPNARFYGGRAFTEDAPSWPDFGACRFILPRIELRTNGTTSQLIGHCWLSEANRQNELAALRQQLLALRQAQMWPKAESIALQPQTSCPDQSHWQTLVEQATSAIARQQFEKVVLARTSYWQIDGALPAFALLQRWQQAEPGNYAFLFKPSANSCFFGAPPERLYARSANQLSSEALAGTIDNSADSHKQRQLAEQLRVDPKNSHENQLVANAITQWLSPLCQQLQCHPVEIVSQRHVQHLRQRFNATLTADCRDQDLIAALHPTPAVAGWPRLTALNWIAEHEPFARGWYAGTFGMVSQSASDLCVAIRCALQQGRQLSIFAGAGIVAGSQADLEWHELDQKIATISGLMHDQSNAR